MTVKKEKGGDEGKKKNREGRERLRKKRPEKREGGSEEAKKEKHKRSNIYMFHSNFMSAEPRSYTTTRQPLVSDQHFCVHNYTFPVFEMASKLIIYYLFYS